MNLFISRLESAMNKANMTAAELARKSKVSESTISQYRNGYCTPKNKKLYAIAVALNVSPAWLMGMDVAQDEIVNSTIVDLYNSLSPEKQEQALQFLQFLKNKDNQ